MNLVGIGLEEIGYEFGENELLIIWGWVTIPMVTLSGHS